MKVCVLFSGGKDSTYALMKAMEKEEVVCLVSIVSGNRESYMFHTPNIGMTDLQARAIGIPLVRRDTEGKKEEELSDLRDALVEAKERFGIQGVVTGAVESVYQSSRVQRICSEVGMRCFNPLWLMDQRRLLEEIVENDFEVMVSGFFAEPFSRKWLGRRIDAEAIEELSRMEKEHGISPSGEGGEIETTVLDAPFFRKRILIEDSAEESEEDSGVLVIKKARLVGK